MLSIYIIVVVLIFAILVALLVMQILKSKQIAPPVAGGKSVGKSVAKPAQITGQVKQLKMDNEWLQSMIDGKKTIDVRLDSQACDKIDKGTNVLYFSGQQEVYTKIVDKNRYDNLASLLEKEKIDAIFPGKKLDAEKATDMFLSHREGGKGYYTKDQLSKPFISLKLKVCEC